MMIIDRFDPGERFGIRFAFVAATKGHMGETLGGSTSLLSPHLMLFVRLTKTW